MKTRDFSFDLPEELIAQYPSDSRGESRLLVLDRQSGTLSHRMVTDLPGLLPDNAVLVLNDSRVRKARVYGVTPDAREREFLFVRRMDRPPEGPAADRWGVMTHRPARLPPGTTIAFPEGVNGTVRGRSDLLVDVETDRYLPESFFERNGHVPLPPYVRREDEPADAERYQTVYATVPGSVAAPTAGLHFTGEILAAVEARGIPVVRVTLHVGIGTFLPVRTEEIDQHVMHAEEYQIEGDAAEIINAALDRGRPVVAVGTTSVRTLEAACVSDRVVPGRRSTDLFIRPGYRFRVVSAMITNFHTPQSTLLMLVCAFAGRERVLAAYREAVARRYRFFSYGDAMLIR